MSGISVLTKEISGTSLKVQWLRDTGLPELETRVQSLVQEDSTCGATKAVCHNH